MNKANTQKRKKLTAGLALLALSSVIVVAITTTPSQSQSTKATTATPVTQSQTSQTAQSNATYKDGTYMAIGSYSSPGGKESIMVTATLANNIVTDVSAQSGANDPTARSYQSIFLSGYKTQVVGKNINTIKLKNVSGSSLTPQGFNSAIQQIEQQAKA